MSGRSMSFLLSLVVLAGCGAIEPRESFAFRITFQVVHVAGVSPTAEQVDVVRTIIQKRLDETGIAAPRVSVAGSDRLVVEASPTGVLEDVRTLVGATGRLDFVPLGSTGAAAGDTIDLTTHPPLFSGDEVAGASIGADQTGRRTVDIVLKEAGKRLLADYTAAHVGDYVAIVLDGMVISAPVINEAIPGGQVQISQNGVDGWPIREAQNLIVILKFGQLPFPLQEIKVGQP